MPGLASFDVYETKSRGTVYRLRFDRISTAVLGDCARVQLFRSTDYIMVKPVAASTADNKTTFLLGRNKKCAIINVGRLVTSGFFHKDLFGHKYAVKRDRKGNLYICLNEVVEDKNSDG